MNTILYSPEELMIMLKLLSQEICDYTGGKNTYDMYIAGGSALALGYDLKASTEDIDTCIKRGNVVRKCMDRVIKANKWLSPKCFGLGVRYSKSYTPAILVYNKLWAELPGLKVYIVDLELILCMKLIAFREKDFEDIFRILSEFKSQGLLVNEKTIYAWYDKYYRKFRFGVPLSAKAKEFISRL